PDRAPWVRRPGGWRGGSSGALRQGGAGGGRPHRGGAVPRAGRGRRAPDRRGPGCRHRRRDQGSHRRLGAGDPVPGAEAAGPSSRCEPGGDPMTASDGTPMDPTVSSPAGRGVDVGPEVDDLLRLATSEPRADELADTRGLASLLEIGGRAPGTLADTAAASDPTESVAAAVADVPVADVPVAGSEVGDGDADELSVRRRRRAGRAVKVVAVAAAIAATAGGVAAAATGHLSVPVLGDKAPV